MGKKRIVAETGAGQHGVASATAAALLGLQCKVYMGEVDVQRQALNVFRMKLLGAEVVPAMSGSRTLKDAVNEAMRDWVATVETTYYALGSVMGPHPYPFMVRTFQSVIGDEAFAQCRDVLDGKDPDVVTACVGGGSNAIGIFHDFIKDKDVKIYKHEPYFQEDYILKKKHLIETWCDLCNVEYDGSMPQIYLNPLEIEETKLQIEDARAAIQALDHQQQEI